MAANGQLPSSDLVALSTPGRLVRDAAEAYEACRRAAGVTGTTYANHAYRDLDEQEDLFRQNYQTSWCEYAPGKVDARYWAGDTWYRKPGANATAVPGTSNHGYGKAVDWQGLGGYGSSSWERFAGVAGDYGWSNTEGKNNGEPWHWVYVGGYNGGGNMSDAEYEKIEKALYQTSNGGVGDNVAMFGTPGGVLSSLRRLLDNQDIFEGVVAAIQAQLDRIEDKVDALSGGTGGSGPVAITPADVDAIAAETTARILSSLRLVQQDDTL